MVRREQTTIASSAPPARGGVSLIGVLTGVVVALGSLALLSVIIAGLLEASGVDLESLADGEEVDIGLGVGAGLLVAQFLSYLWGGYVAGRMARGAGALNGVLVPVGTLIAAGIVGAVGTALGADADLSRELFGIQNLAITDDVTLTWSIGLVALAIVVMFLASLIGGLLGTNWHTRLERFSAEQYASLAGTTLEEEAPAPPPPGEERPSGLREKAGLHRRDTEEAHK